MEFIYIHNMYPKLVYKRKFGHSKFQVTPPPPTSFVNVHKPALG